MPEAPDPTVQRRRLRAELRSARTEAGLTQRQAAEALDWSPSKLLRIENGSVSISTTDLKALLALYGIQDPVKIEELVRMAQSARRHTWSAYRDVFSHEFIVYLGYESSASIIRQVEPLLIPGLLQTEEYADVILRLASWGKAT